MAGQQIDVSAVRPGSQLPGLNGLRGLAALAVAAFHTVFVPQPHLSVPDAIGGLVSSLWHGVTLFFILSAFVLAHATAPLVGTDRWILRYGLRRFFRIAPLFYALLAGFVAWRPSSVGLWQILSNMAFVFNFDSRFYQSIVWAGWTIGVEVPFYAILPVLLCCIRTRRHAAWALGAAVAISIPSRFFLMTVGSPYADLGLTSFTSNLPMFAAGLLAWHVLVDQPVTATLRRFLMWGTLLTLVLAVAIIPFPTPPILPPPSDPKLAQILWVIPLGLACAWQAVAPSRWLSSAPIQWVGNHSFSCYLLHPPIVYLLGYHGIFAAIQRDLDPAVGAWSFLPCVGLTYALVLLASALSYRLIELPGQHAGRWLIGRMRRNVPVTP